MTGNDGRNEDEATGALALLGIHEPGRARAARVRARCHAGLEKRRRRALQPARPDWRRTLEPAIVGALCAVYLVEVLGRAVLLYGF
jgi:hypothetical protein